MIHTILYHVQHIFSLNRLTGPIFDKELRVSSRRRRNYLLRFVYLLLLMFFVVIFWLEATRYGRNYSNLYSVSRMAQAGKLICATIMWFQFVMLQIIAVISLSNSISDEIYHRTLGVLMTTPINSLQIVLGKLFSKILQILILLAITLPLLAIVRVFGGVPWSYIVESTLITLNTVLLLGSISLFFSIFTRRSYIVIILTVITLATLFAFVPLFLTYATIKGDSSNVQQVVEFIFTPNPYATFTFNTIEMIEPRAMGLPAFNIFTHCILLLPATIFLICLSIYHVRRVALNQITGHVAPASTSTTPSNSSNPANQPQPPKIKTIKGSPILWKELQSPIFGRRKALIACVLTPLILIAFFFYFLFANYNDLDDKDVHVGFTHVYFWIGLLFTVILPATTITSEKESQSWPLLLATPLEERQILFGKFMGTLRRILPLWIPMFAHLIVFVLCKYIHPMALFLQLIIVVAITVFLFSSGLYFSNRFKRTTTAVIANISLALGIWLVIPLFTLLLCAITRADIDLLDILLYANPVIQNITMMLGTAGPGNAHEVINSLRFEWPFGYEELDVTFTALGVSLVVYSILGGAFLTATACRIRQKVF